MAVEAKNVHVMARHLRPETSAASDAEGGPQLPSRGAPNRAAGEQLRTKSPTFLFGRRKTD